MCIESLPGLCCLEKQLRSMVALLLPARFLTLAAHFIATAMTFYSVVSAFRLPCSRSRRYRGGSKLTTPITTNPSRTHCCAQDDNVKASLSTPFAQTDYDSVHSA